VLFVASAPTGELVPAKMVLQPDGEYKVEYSSKFTGEFLLFYVLRKRTTSFVNLSAFLTDKSLILLCSPFRLIFFPGQAIISESCPVRNLILDLSVLSVALQIAYDRDKKLAVF